MNALHPGDRLDRYRIGELVATGGMASIFRGTDLRTGQQVAIKVPHFEMECDPNYFERFRREAEIGRQMDHPGVMKVMPEEDPSRLYMAMEWVEGRPLREILSEQKKIPAERAVRIATQVCDALEYIHAQGVAHRDLKPENIMVDAEDRIKLIDFGIAANTKARRLTFGKLTRTVGTPDYISPEQVRGKRGDARSDVYSLGIVLYEMLAGDVPFQGPNPLVVMNDRLKTDPIPLRGMVSEITPQLEEIIRRALERDPRNRYAAAREFAWDLNNQDKVGITSRPEAGDWRQQPSPQSRMSSAYLLLLFIPVVILALLLFVARKP